MTDLDPEIVAAAGLDASRFGVAPQHLPHDPQAARAEQERRRAPWNEGGPQMAVQRDLTIDLAGRTLTARLYVPHLPARGLVLYFHGGGWVIGSLATHDRLTRMLADHSGLAFLSVAYRKAPEHPYPAAVDDACDVWQWLADHPGVLGFDVAMDKIAVAGDSAGANIAFAAALTMIAAQRPAPIATASLYGVLDSNLDTVSYLMRGDGRYGLSRANMGLYWQLYCPDVQRRIEFPAAPVRAPDSLLAQLRRPFLLAAGLDPLRDDSRRMRDVLVAAGVDTVYVEFPRANHAFMHLSASVGVSRTALLATAQHLKAAFDAL